MVYNTQNYWFLEFIHRSVFYKLERACFITIFIEYFPVISTQISLVSGN
jgi:hypothetical protein